MRKVLMITLLGSLLLAACATLPAQEQSPTEAPVVVSPAPAETQVPPAAGKTPVDVGKGSLPEGVVIEFRRSGGIAGVNEDWFVYSDGRITQGGNEWQVTPEQVQELLAKIETLGFFEMKGSYTELNTCCDRFTYELTVRSGDKVNRVSTIDAAPGAPAELWQVIDGISNLVKQ
jgi:hypothetical protein